jgi:hypothetical protein
MQAVDDRLHEAVINLDTLGVDIATSATLKRGKGAKHSKAHTHTHTYTHMYTYK